MGLLAWQCADCGGLNSMSRDKCGKCNGKKNVKIKF